MATLLIRNIGPSLHARLKARAAAHHRSLEEEVRTLLRTGLARSEAEAHPEDLVSLATQLFGPQHGVELAIPPRDRMQDRPPPEFPTGGTCDRPPVEAVGPLDRQRRVSYWDEAGFRV